jgi:hypothetical protein
LPYLLINTGLQPGDWWLPNTPGNRLNGFPFKTTRDHRAKATVLMIEAKIKLHQYSIGTEWQK